MIYLQLFWSFFQIGLFSFGGGYAAMPLIQSQVVTQHGWLTLMEFTDLIAISQMTPGPIAINSATFVGMRIAGLGGAMVATLGNIIPSCIIVFTLAYLYKRYGNMPIIQGVMAGLRPTVVALILSAGLSILCMSFWSVEISKFTLSLLGSTDVIALLLFGAGLFLLRKFKLNPLLVMAGCGIIGGVCYLIL